MIIPRHKICDLCEKEVGINVRYYIVKSKCIYESYSGSCRDNQKHHICEECMGKIRNKILSDNRKKVIKNDTIN